MDVKHGSLALMEEYKLRVLQNRVLMRIFGPKRDDVIDWRKLHNEKLHNLYSSPSIIRRSSQGDKMDRACSMHEGEKKYIQDFDGKEGKRLLRRSRHTWENNINMGLTQDGAVWAWY
jgi:hypothetical protein